MISNYKYFQYTEEFLNQIVSTECTLTSTIAKIATFVIIPFAILETIFGGLFSLCTTSKNFTSSVNYNYNN